MVCVYVSVYLHVGGLSKRSKSTSSFPLDVMCYVNQFHTSFEEYIFFELLPYVSNFTFRNLKMNNIISGEKTKILVFILQLRKLIVSRFDWLHANQYPGHILPKGCFLLFYLC